MGTHTIEEPTQLWQVSDRDPNGGPGNPVNDNFDVSLLSFISVTSLYVYLNSSRAAVC